MSTSVLAGLLWLVGLLWFITALIGGGTTAFVGATAAWSASIILSQLPGITRDKP